MKEARPVAIGRIDYANAWPLFHYFDEKKLSFPVEVVSRVPSQLNRFLRDGTLDVAAISSFAYGEAWEDYYLLPDLSVSSVNRVNSILLFMGAPLDEVCRGTIALTHTSATSINLLKMIMRYKFQGSPAYVMEQPDLPMMLASADAGMLIGDPAIQASWKRHPYEVLDLGEVWRDWTGHGMTFAVIAVRKAFAERYPLQVAEIYAHLLESKHAAQQQPAVLVDKACAEIGGQAAYWERYFSELNYDFGSAQQAGLARYFGYAEEMELLKGNIGLQFWADQSVVQVKK